MKRIRMEQLLSSELDEIRGGRMDDDEEDVCICENGGAQEVVVIVQKFHLDA